MAKTYPRWLEYEFRDAQASAVEIQNLVSFADFLGVWRKVDCELASAVFIVEVLNEAQELGFWMHRPPDYSS